MFMFDYLRIRSYRAYFNKMKAFLHKSSKVYEKKMFFEDCKSYLIVNNYIGVEFSKLLEGLSSNLIFLHEMFFRLCTHLRVGSIDN